MKTLFLDIDGCLNNKELFHSTGRIDPIGDEFLDRLEVIVKETDAKIVLSSTWRLCDRNKKKVEDALATRELKLFDCTIEIRRKLSEWVPRAEEIREWLSRFPEVQKFAILDDNSDAGEGLEHSFFQTTFDDGLTNEIMMKVIEHFLN